MTRTIPARAAKILLVPCFRMALFYCISRPVCKRRNPFRGQNRENRKKRQNTPIQLKTAQTGQTGLLGQNRLIRLKTVYSSKTGENQFETKSPTLLDSAKSIDWECVCLQAKTTKKPPGEGGNIPKRSDKNFVLGFFNAFCCPRF